MKMSIIVEMNAKELKAIRSIFKLAGQELPDMKLDVLTTSKFETMLVMLRLKDTMRVQINQEITEQLVLELEKLAGTAVPAIKAALPLLELISTNMKGPIKEFLAFSKKVQNAKKKVTVLTETNE